jgi:hypothetical protein
LDRNDQPILYYPARPGPRNPALARTYIGNTVATPGPEDFTWDVGDNRFDKDRPPVYVSKGDFQAMVGEYDGSGAIEQGGTVPEQELANGPYILWGAGPDGSFGLTFPDNDLHPDRLKPEQAILNSKAAQTCDDVTNFRN